MKHPAATDLKKDKGFTLIELLIVVSIIVMVSIIVAVIINPLEYLRRGRDTTRMSDLTNIQTAIISALADAGSSSTSVLCYNTTSPCSANSNDGGANIRKNDGTGWVKVNFAGQATINFPTLPIDPINTTTYRYSYYSDGTSFELNTALESQSYQTSMSSDGGDNTSLYERGTKLTLLH